MIDARLRTLAAGAAVVAALGTAAACGGHGAKAAAPAAPSASRAANSPRTDTLTALRTAMDKVSRAHSADVRSTVTFQGTTTRTSGALDWSGGLRSTMDIKLSGAAGAKLKQVFGDDVMKARYLPDAVYVGMGGKLASLDGGKPWIRYTYDSMATYFGASGAVLRSASQNADPNRSVQLLVASGDVKRAGEETVSGVRTTRYTGSFDAAQIAAAGRRDGLDAKTVADLRAQLTADGITGEHLEVWVDGDGLLVKRNSTMRTKDGPISMVGYYSHYGVKVSVAPPPASQTVDFAQMMRQSGKS